MANKVFNDSSAEQSSQVAHQSKDADHDIVEIDPFIDTDPVRQAKIMELDLIPQPSEWKDVFYHVR